MPGYSPHTTLVLKTLIWVMVPVPTTDLRPAVPTTLPPFVSKP